MNLPENKLYEFGDFRLDPSKRLLFTTSGETIPLMPKAFDTLLYLTQNSGRIIEKDEILSSVWADTVVEENNLTQNISVLRRIFGEKPGEHRYIVTVPGRGYKFVAAVRDLPEPAEVGPDAEEFQISNFRFQNENQSEIEDLKFEITGNPVSKPENPKLKSEVRATYRVWPAAALILFIAGLAFLGFYLSRETESSLAVPIKTLAVLPFKPLAENRNEALELGMADNLISRLSGSGDISVRPLNAVLRYNSLEQDPLAAAASLRADAVLDGSIQTWGDRIRVSARLIRTSDGKQMWADQFDEKFTDIFSVQDSISQKVAAALQLRLGIQKRFTENVEAYQYYANGLYHRTKLTKPDIEKALTYFQKAIDVDPAYALAYVGLAETYYPMALTMEMPSGEPMMKAKAAAERAIEIDPELADGHAAIGLIKLWYEWDWTASERNFQRAEQLNPNRPHWGYAHLLSNTGRHDEALAQIKRARELDPVNGIIGSIEGQALFFAGKNDEALDRLRKTIELYPNFWLAHLFISRVYSEKGMHPEAVAAADKAFELSRSSQANAYRAFVLAKSGRIGDTERILSEMKKDSETRYVPAYTLAEVYNVLGDTGKALEYLEKGIVEKDVRMVFLKIDPMWDNLRAEPQFAAVFKQMNFEYNENCINRLRFDGKTH
ncbi:MAG: winged helix-turn-helix domain-containing protein [Pyrinomonadaceae bacterium]